MPLNFWTTPRRVQISTMEGSEFRRHRLSGKWQQRDVGASWEVCGPVTTELLNALLSEAHWVLVLWGVIGVCAFVALTCFFAWLILNI